SLVRNFIEQRFAEAWSRPDLKAAHRAGPTYEEAQALARPLPPLHPRQLFWSTYRATLKVTGLFSAGVAL
ncbi:MAG TPA: class I SAM-dependent methyltransferase family protein, partial [Rhodocyclaceae bacterium]|nr:class I SAM-dependent methyltransferase family protein [Rhodocyclaceae bacterium]